MELKDQVTSLETSKKLKELGVKQDSLHWWARSREGVNVPLEKCIWSEWELYNFYAEDVKIDDGEAPREEVNISAFTASELAEMLPNVIEYRSSTKELSGFDGYRPLYLSIGRTIIDDGWYVLYSDPYPANKVPCYNAWGSILVEALAARLIHLLENNILTPKP